MCARARVCHVDAPWCALPSRARVRSLACSVATGDWWPVVGTLRMYSSRGRGGTAEIAGWQRHTRARNRLLYTEHHEHQRQQRM